MRLDDSDTGMDGTSMGNDKEAKMTDSISVDRRTYRELVCAQSMCTGFGEMGWCECVRCVQLGVDL